MLFVILFAAGIIDLKYRKIPKTVIALMVIYSVTFGNLDIYERICGAVIPALPLFIIALKNKRINGGDIKYLAALGLNVGISQLTGILLLACILSGMYFIIWKKNSVPLAFVCFLGYVFWR